MKTFIFKVKLKHDRRIWRKVEALGSQTLDDLHLAIQEAYGFDGDHLYSYFMSGKAWDLSDYEYHHPDAAPQTPIEERMRTMMAKIRGRYPEPRLPATDVSIQSLNFKPKQKFLYLFDYGDEWQFEVEFVIEGASEEVRYPRIIDLRGESPQQYADYGGEET
jgi:hypothetical protein